MLKSHELACAPKADPHFIGDEQDAMLVTVLGRPGGSDITALAQQRFDDDGCCLRGRCEWQAGGAAPASTVGWSLPAPSRSGTSRGIGSHKDARGCQGAGLVKSKPPRPDWPTAVFQELCPSLPQERPAGCGYASRRSKASRGSSSSRSTTMSAVCNASAGLVVVTAIHFMPARCAPSTPAVASSTTTQRSGGT